MTPAAIRGRARPLNDFAALFLFSLTQLTQSSSLNFPKLLSWTRSLASQTSISRTSEYSFVWISTSLLMIRETSRTHKELMPRSPLLNTHSITVQLFPSSGDRIINTSSYWTGASVVLMSHLGRPDGVAKPEFSLKPIVPVLQKAFPRSAWLFAIFCCCRNYP